MNQLTKQEIIKALAWYHNCDVQIMDAVPSTPAYIEGVMYGQEDVEGNVIRDGKVWAEYVTWEPDIIKPILKPLPHLTNAEILMACRAYDNLPFMFTKGGNIEIAPTANPSHTRVVIQDTPYVYIFHGDTGGIGLYKGSNLVSSQETQLRLTQHYFLKKVAIPLYFDYGHWANGKTAIELGIAVPDRFRLFEALSKKFNDKTAEMLWMHEQEDLYKVDFNNLATLNAKIAELSLPGAVV